VELFAWFEADGFAWSDGDLGACAWIAADACLAWFDGEDTETSKFDAVAADKALLHGVKDSVDSRLCLGLGQAGAIDYPLDDVLLDQESNLSCATITRYLYGLRRVDVILETVRKNVNAGTVVLRRIYRTN